MTSQLASVLKNTVTEKVTVAAEEKRGDQERSSQENKFDVICSNQSHHHERTGSEATALVQSSSHHERLVSNSSSSHHVRQVTSTSEQQEQQSFSGSATFGKDSVLAGSQVALQKSSEEPDLLAMLRHSIMMLNTKFDKFNETVTGKIERIEQNYEDLSAKIERLHTCKAAQD